MGHFRDESFQSITCTGSANLTGTTKRKSTDTKRCNNNVALVNSTKHTQKKPRIKQRTDRVWFSCLLQYPARKWIWILCCPQPYSALGLFICKLLHCCILHTRTSNRITYSTNQLVLYRSCFFTEFITVFGC